MAATGSPLQRHRHSTAASAAPSSSSNASNSSPRQHHESNPHGSNLLAPASASASASVSASPVLLTPASGPSPSSSYVSVRTSNLSPSPSPSPAALANSPPVDLSGSTRGSSPALRTPSFSSIDGDDDDDDDFHSPAQQDFGLARSANDNGDVPGTRNYGHNYYNSIAMATWSGQSSIKGGSEAMRMILLNFINIGITFTWGVEMTYCTPYLLDLGLTKSNTSLVWVAGPLSGLLVQPIVGVISDESRSKWGRRRPLMVIGSVIVVACLLVLGFTREIIHLFIKDEQAARMPTIVLAVLAIYVLDFAINAVQSCAKSLVVDTLPIDKQQAGAAWTSRLSAVGNVIGYGAGALDLPSVLGKSLGDTQFKQLTIVSTFFYVVSTAVTCWAVTERALVSSKALEHQGRFNIFRQIISKLRNLPPRIQAICWAQFWSWIGWFPFLFYSTTWIGETYFRYDVPADARKSSDTLGAIGRIGSTSLVLYSIITFSSAWVLPLFVKSPDDDSFTHRPPQALAGFLARFNKIKPDLLTAWMLGHLMFAAAMALAPFATSFRFATVLVCLCGIPWTLALWAPVAFLGVEVNKLSSSAEASYHRLSNDIELPNISSEEAHPHLEHGSESNSPPAAGSTGELSGIYFGILNIYTTLPQFIGTFLSSIVFSILEPSNSSSDSKLQSDPDGPNPIAVCLFIGAMSTLVAAYMTRKLRFL